MKTLLLALLIAASVSQGNPSIRVKADKPAGNNDQML